MKRFLLTAVLALCSLTTLHAQPSAKNSTQQPPKISTVVTWEKERIVTYCMKTEGLPLICKQGIMPMKIGEVKSILQGDFVSNRRPNWLVFANSKIALCSITNHAKTICVPVIGGDDYINYKFSFQSGTLKISPSDDARISSFELTKEYSSLFATALKSASEKLRVEIDSYFLPKKTPSVQGNASSKARAPAEESMSTMESKDEDMPIDWEDNPGGGGGVGGGGGGGGSGNGGCYPPACYIIPIPPPPTNPGSIPDPWDLSLPDLGTPIKSLCERIGFCSTDEEKQLEAEEAKRCEGEYQYCRQHCSDLMLGTPPGNQGWNQVVCVNSCMRTTGCKGWL